MPGQVVHLQLAKSQSRNPVASANALENCGLEGDKYARTGRRRQVLLVEQEVLDEFGLPPGALDEQITVAGAALSTFPERTRFRVGDVLLEVVGPCEPCHKMNRHGPGMQERLLGKRGTLAKVVEGGVIRIGDQVCAST